MTGPSSISADCIRGSVGGGGESARDAAFADGALTVVGARVHNLRNLSVDLPLGRLVGLTGVSGSGKSTLAFDVLFAEGQRRYLESLSIRTRQALSPLPRPDVDRIDGLPAAVCIDQRVGSAHPRSTLATLTEVADFLRLLYARAGQAHCPQCGRPVSCQTPAEIVDGILAAGERRKAILLAPLVRGQRGEHRGLFERIVKEGYVRARVDGEVVDVATPPKLAKSKPHTIEAIVDRIIVKDGLRPRLVESVRAALRLGEGQCLVSLEEGAGWTDRLYSERFACAPCGVSYANLEPRTFSFNSPAGACPACEGLGTTTADGPETTCAECGGARLNVFARHVTIAGKPLPALLAMTVDQALSFLRAATSDAITDSASADSRAAETASVPRDVFTAVAAKTVPDVLARLRFLERVGLGYLTLDRPATTLSGGEFQRARLASSLGMDLSGVCYVLDEPTAGLHPADTERLLDTMLGLRDQGSTVLVVEHDLDIIRRCDWVIDLGPGAGPEGGRLVAEGPPDTITRCDDSVTGRYLRDDAVGAGANLGSMPTGANDATKTSALNATKSEPDPRAEEPSHWLTLSGARRNNLQNVTIRVPLNRLVCVTGVSGSGKSTLVSETLAPAIARALPAANPTVGRTDASRSDMPTPAEFDTLTGVEALRRIVTIDQTPLGRNSRSNPATYTGAWDEIRKLFAKTKEARLRGFTPRRFRMSDPEGRCPTCRGLGMLPLRLDPLPAVESVCPSCRGARFNRRTLSVRYGGQSAADVLAMRLDAAAEFFTNIPRVHRPLRMLVDIGLGYLTLGRSSTTLSGGEAQRVKLAAELSRESHEPTLFVLDEPTTGLHPADADRLLAVLRRLVDHGHTVLVVEHHLGLIAASDWVIDLGPGAGMQGGLAVAEGPPERVAQSPDSATGRALRAISERCGNPKNG